MDTNILRHTHEKHTYQHILMELHIYIDLNNKLKLIHATAHTQTHTHPSQHTYKCTLTHTHSQMDITILHKEGDTKIHKPILNKF